MSSSAFCLAIGGDLPTGPTVSPTSAFPTDSFHNSNVCRNEVTKYPEPTPSLELRQWSIYLCRIVNFALLHFEVDGREKATKYNSIKCNRRGQQLLNIIYFLPAPLAIKLRASC